jgi:hypothetical protein
LLTTVLLAQAARGILGQWALRVAHLLTLLLHTSSLLLFLSSLLSNIALLVSVVVCHNLLFYG